MNQVYKQLNGKQRESRSTLFSNTQFWSILIIFILITLHHYDNLTEFRLVSIPDLPLGITRHTIDRILYLVPIILSSLVFGSRGGLITLGAALIAMLPRALFISPNEVSSLLETFTITLIGSLAPLGIGHYRNQEEQLEMTMEKLDSSEKRYRQLFENAHDAIWVQDLDGRVIAANQAAAELFRYDLSALDGMDSRHIFSNKGIALSKTIQKDLLKGYGGQEPYKQEIVRKDGTKAHIMLTANLIISNGHPSGVQFIGRDITKEVRMQENQSFYLQQITRAHEEERQRISRDLHDSTAQSLIATLRSLEKFCEEDKQLSPGRLELLWNYHGQLRDALQEIRQLSRDLRPSILDHLGLLPAVEWLVEQLRTENKVDASVTVSGDERRFSPEVEVTLFRIIQEALRNTARHAEATEAWVTVNFKAKETIISIIDNGKGFELPPSLGELSRLGKLGVDGMQTRARLVGGTFDIQSSPNDGTAIVVIVPA